MYKVFWNSTLNNFSEAPPLIIVKHQSFDVEERKCVTIKGAVFVYFAEGYVGDSKEMMSILGGREEVKIGNPHPDH